MNDKLKNPVSSAKELAELGCVHMSEEARSKMSLNPHDQLFICRLMTMRDDATKDELAEIVLAQNTKMFAMLDEQTRLIMGMSIDINSIKIHIATHDGELRHLNTRLDIKKKRLDDVEGDVKHIKKRILSLENKIKAIGGNVFTIDQKNDKSDKK